MLLKEMSRYIYGQLPRYKNLVFEGGGIRGVAYLGALHELSIAGILDGIESFAGTSAGSIAAAILACGGSIEFMEQFFGQTNFADLLDCSSWKLRNLYDIVSTWGLCSGDIITEKISAILKTLLGNPDITFQQAHNITGKELIITGVCLSTRNVKYFSRRNYPDMQIALAIRISCSIPIVFKPVEFDGRLWVDGGCLDNYPMRAYHVIHGDSITIPEETLGLTLKSDIDINKQWPPIESIASFASSLIATIRDSPQKIHIDSADKMRTITIPTGGISSTHFGLTEGEKQSLISSGRESVAKFFGATN